MALFGSYAPPGVYTTVQIAAAGQPLFGNARIPVIIGRFDLGGVGTSSTNGAVN